MYGNQGDELCALPIRLHVTRSTVDEAEGKSVHLLANHTRAILQTSMISAVTLFNKSALRT